MKRLLKGAAWVYCVLALVVGAAMLIDGFVNRIHEDDIQIPEVQNVRTMNLSTEKLDGNKNYYIESLQILERYAFVSSNTIGGETDHTEEYLNEIKGGTISYEYFTVLFYDSTGKPYVASMKVTAFDELCGELNPENSGEISIPAYICLNDEDYNDFPDEIEELRVQSLKAQSEKFGAGIIGFYTDYYAGTKDEYVEMEKERIIESDDIAGFAPVPIIIGTVGILLLYGYRKKPKENESI